MQYTVLLIVLLVLAAVYFIVRNRKINVTNSQQATKKSNVISMDRHRKAKQSPGEQICSSCKKNGKITFYAQDNGTVVGLCKECQSKGKKRDMLPL